MTPTKPTPRRWIIENVGGELRCSRFVDSYEELVELSAYLDLERRLGIAVAGVESAIEYLEPRLASKYGSRGLTIVLPSLREALSKIRGES